MMDIWIFHREDQEILNTDPLNSIEEVADWLRAVDSDTFEIAKSYLDKEKPVQIEIPFINLCDSFSPMEILEGLYDDSTIEKILKPLYEILAREAVAELGVNRIYDFGDLTFFATNLTVAAPQTESSDGGAAPSKTETSETSEENSNESPEDDGAAPSKFERLVGIICGAAPWKFRKRLGIFIWAALLKFERCKV